MTQAFVAASPPCLCVATHGQAGAPIDALHPAFPMFGISLVAPLQIERQGWPPLGAALSVLYTGLLISTLEGKPHLRTVARHVTSIPVP